mgnify:CR=1 FL=1
MVNPYSDIDFIEQEADPFIEFLAQLFFMDMAGEHEEVETLWLASMG